LAKDKDAFAHYMIAFDPGVGGCDQEAGPSGQLAVDQVSNDMGHEALPQGDSE